MQKYFHLPLFLLAATLTQAQIISIKKAAKHTAVNKTNSNIETGINNAADKAESGIKGIFKSRGKTDAASDTPPEAGDTTAVKPVDTAIPAAGFKAYNNYDFIPGNKILFEDDFRDDTDGEFPSHWGLEGGQGVVNKMGDDEVFAITRYYSIYTPDMKTPAYLPAQYTIEFDTWLDASYDSNEGVYMEFRKGQAKLGGVYTNHSAFRCETSNNRIQGDLPAAVGGDGYHNKWHHIAIAVKDNQLKMYCDQYRVLTVPNMGFKATSLALGGNASEGAAMLIKNFRLAEGGGMNMPGRKFTDTKIVTHGISFDYNKAGIRPESMGILNMIVQIMKDNPEIKFEVGGHTDSDGDDKYNMNLSAQRAQAVKTQLASMGVDAARLTARGYGETKPISNNTTPEGKAENRRVEFVKL